jgi:hypothetical protein
MKKISILLVLLAALTFNSYSQCDKKIILTSSVTEYLHADSTVERTEDEHTQVEFDKNTITIIPGSDDHTMTGTIKSISCNWSTPFKEGKTVLKIALTHDGNQTVDVTITITGKNGKISFLAEVDQENGKKIRLVVDKFEEKAG